MMRVDGRRLVRAVAVGLLCFAMVGGGIGFVAAATGPGHDQLAVPAPRPGDRAVFAASEVITDESQAKGGAGYILLDEVVYEWLPERAVHDANFAVRTAWPLRIEYIFAKGEPSENHEVREAFFDAATGQVLFETNAEGSDSYVGRVVSVNGLSPFGTKIHRDFRIDRYLTPVGPCGLLSPLHGTEYDGSPLQMPGRCDWPGGHDTLTFDGDGWKQGPRGRTYELRAVEDSRIGLTYDLTSPFPVRSNSTLAGFFNDAYTYGRLWDLQRISYQPGSGFYTPVDVPASDPVLVDRLPRTPWMLDDTGIDMELPLGEAYAAALAQAAPAAPRPEQAQPPIPQPVTAQWLAAHPTAYLGSAMRLESTDRQGQHNPSWLLLWVEGDAWLGKQVAWEPVTLGGVGTPEALGRMVVVHDWMPSWIDDIDVGSYFPPLDKLPESLPSPAALMARYADLYGADRVVNRYGFEARCAASACTEVLVVVEVGREDSVQEDLLFATDGIEQQRVDLRIDRLQVDQDGRTAFRIEVVDTQEGVFPLIPSSQDGQAEALPAPIATANAVWTVPVGAAATGLSLLALVASALYYFWPALKNAALAPLFSRIEDEDVLKHPNRARILELIRAEPGIHFQDLARKAGIGRGTLEHHLRKLVEAELVTVRRTSGYSCCFPKGAGAIDRRLMDAAPVLRSEGGRAVLQVVARRPGTSSRDLAVELGLAPSTVSYHLKKLEMAGLVLPDPAAGVRLTPLGEQAHATAAA